MNMDPLNLPRESSLKSSMSVGHENSEKNVIQLKRSFLLTELSNLIKFVSRSSSHQGLFKTLTEELVPEESMRRKLKLQSTEYEVLTMLIHYLSENCSRETFDILLDILNGYDISKSAALELTCYLEIESGASKPSEVIVFEAGMYEHEEMGCSKKRTQNDKRLLKKILIHLLASRQHVQDSQSEGQKRKLSIILRKLELMVFSLSVMFEKLKEYVADHDEIIEKTVSNEEIVKMKSLTNKNEGKEDKFEELLQILKVMIQSFSHCISEINVNSNEKKACITILKSQDESIPLDINMAETFNEMQNRIKMLKQAISDSDKKALELNEEILRLNALKKNYAKQSINSWKGEKKAMSGSLDYLIRKSDEIAKKKQDIIDAQKLLEMWKVKVSLIAKSEQLKRTNEYVIISGKSTKAKHRKSANKIRKSKLNLVSTPRFKTHRMHFNNRLRKMPEKEKTYMENMQITNDFLSKHMASIDVK